MNATGNWKISEPNFFPLGIFTNSNKNKTVFVTWSKNTLITYIFKKSGKSNSLTDTYPITINEQIKNIIVTEFNTICLTESGRLYYFASCKSLKLIEFLSDVRCLCSNHNGFSLIRVENNDQIYLETYEDFSGYDQIITRHEKHEITFDETNIFDTSWKDKRFLIATVKIDEINKKLMKTVTKHDDCRGVVHLFTITNSLYSVYSKVQDEQAEINLLHTVATTIESIHYLNNTQSILIFTCCGCLEILYLSKGIFQRSVFKLNSNIISLSLAENSFFYSTEEMITQKTLAFNDDSQKITLYTNERPVWGIVAMTWVKSLKKLICLSENNIFYRIKFSLDIEKSKASNNHRGCYELNEQNIRSFQNNFADLAALCSTSTKIEHQVEKEYTKQNLLNMIKRTDPNIYVGHVQVALESLPFPTDFDFVRIRLELVKDNVLKVGNWKLLLTCADRWKFMKLLNVSVEIETIQFVQQIKKDSLLHLRNIQFHLVSSVTNDENCVCISLPVAIKNCLSPKLQFFEDTILDATNNTNVQEKLFEIAKNCALLQHMDIKEKEFHSSFEMPLLMDKKDISEWLGFPNNLEKLNIELFGKAIKMQFHEVGCYLQLISKCPVALYCLKILLVKKMSTKFTGNDGKKEIKFITKLKALKAEISNLHYNPSYGGLQMFTGQILKSYEKMRSQIKDFAALNYAIDPN